MTIFIHDQFSKDYLEALLAPSGKVESPKRVAGEGRLIDVYFTPNSQQKASLQSLGLLGQFTQYPAILEPYRNAATADEIGDCLLKQLEVKAFLRRKANRAKRNKKSKKNKNEKTNKKLKSSEIPKVWILTPTASKTKLSYFGASARKGWPKGVYFLAPGLRAAIVAIHQLPKRPETLWLRVLGRGKVQEQAIDELEALPDNNPYKEIGLELLYNLRNNLEAEKQPNETDRELIMRLKPLYQQEKEQIQQQSRQEGRQEGRQEERRTTIENLLKVRFRSIDNELQSIVETLLPLSPEEFTPLLIQLSQLPREELLARFARQS